MTKVDKPAIEEATRMLLTAIGEDPTRSELVETPERVARFWQEFLGNQHQPRIDTSFDSIKIDQLVVVSGIRAWSLCEHHLLPFWVDVTVGYLTEEKILGLSKFGRIVQKIASRPQVQERLVQQIASEIQEILGCKNLAVIARGEHLCMSMRGVKTPAIMISSVMTGEFQVSEVLKMEFLNVSQVYGKHAKETL